ncbi:MAG: hypothetical protein WD875_06370 [Pirellulales bacterium]
MPTFLSLRRRNAFRVVGLFAAIAVAVVSVAVVAARRSEAQDVRPAAFPVVLRPSSGTDGGEAAWESLLAREIGRQALLNAARDQLGLPTRDLLLLEADRAAAEDAGRLLDVRFSPVMGSQTTAVVRRVQGESREQLLKEKVPCGQDEPMSYKPLLDFADRLSRKEFVDGLKKAGFSGQPIAMKDHGDVPAAIERLLSRMSIPAQFAAVRQLHALSRKDGYSPEVLGALIRGYANLSTFEELHWSSAHEVFKARALLYAHRMKLAGDGPWARWHRAYAWTLSGVHSEALHDLSAADKMVAEGKPTPAAKDAKPPEWVAVIRAACRFQTGAKSYLSAAGSPYRELAMLLEVRNLELNKITPIAQPSLFNPIGFQRIRELGAALPHCSRIDEAVHATTSSDTHAEIAAIARENFANWLYRELRDVPELPDDAAAIVAAQIKRGRGDQASEYRARADLIASLYRAGDADTMGEPSWGMLAALIEDTTFMWCHCQVGENDDLDEDGLADLLQLYDAMIRRHPFREVLQLAGINPGLRRESYASVLEAIDVANVPYFDDFTYRRFPGNDLLQKFRDAGHRHLDVTYAGLVTHTRLVNPEFRLRLANQLYAVSPYSPLSVAIKIETDWNGVKARAAEWEQRYAGELPVMRALGLAYHAEHKNADAVRCLKRYAEVIHEFPIYKVMADALRRDNRPQDVVDMWRQACAVSTHPPTLAACRNEWMRTLIDAARYGDAIEAAESMPGSPLDALALAAEAAEYDRRYDDAEARLRNIAEAADGEWPVVLWYVCCRRTGRGGVDAAKSAAESYLASCESQVNYVREEDCSIAGRLALAMGQADRARPLLERAQRSQLRLVDAWHQVLLAIEADDARTRDELLARMTAQGSAAGAGPLAATALRVTKLLLEATKADKPLDEANLKDVLARCTTDERVRMCYFVARYFELRGDRAAAKSWYTESVRVPRGCLERTLACIRLRELGVEPNDVKVTAWPGP